MGGELRPLVGSVRQVRRLEDGAPLLAVTTHDASNEASTTFGKDLEVNILGTDGEESAYLISRDNPRRGMWKEYLKTRENSGTPVYLKVDEDNEVREVLPTYLYIVESVEVVEDDSGLEALVFFRQSPAVHILNGKHKLFEKLLALLLDAAEAKREVQVTCLLTAHKIVDVQLAPEPLAVPEESGVNLTGDDQSSQSDLTPESFETHLTISKAIEVFDFLSTNISLQIPFKSPEDGCVERAHLMCRLMRQQFEGLRAKKIWNYGSGYANERATLEFFPDSQVFSVVRWNYHVAPIVSVPECPERLLVLDPAMFPEWPVSVETWLRAQYDPKTVPFGSSDMALWRLPNGEENVGEFVDDVDKKLSERVLSWKGKRMEFLFPTL